MPSPTRGTWVAQVDLRVPGSASLPAGEQTCFQQVGSQSNMLTPLHAGEVGLCGIVGEGVN